MTAITVYQDYKTKNCETKTILLTAPIIHIGSQFSKLNPFEYVQDSGNVYLPDSNALSRALHKKGGTFLNDYIARIEKNESIETLLRNAFGNDWSKMTTPEGQEVFPHSCSKWTQNNARVTDLRPMIRNGLGDLYIPGSSIKGAMRTAIAYYLLKHSDQYNVPQTHKVSAIEDQLREKMRDQHNLKRQAKFLDDGLFMDEIFSKFSLRYQDHDLYSNCRVSNPNKDFLRALKISDSRPLKIKNLKLKNEKIVKANEPVVTEVIISSHYQDGKAKNRGNSTNPICVEMVTNVHTEFTISLDKEVLSWFHHQNGMELPFNSIDELLTICAEFAQEQWQREAQYWEGIENHRDGGKNLDFDLIWENYYGKKTCPYTLRMGWGSGLMGTTVDCLFQDEIVSQLRDICGIRAPGFEAPKSRRTMVNHEGDIRFAPGWVKLKIK